MSRNWLTDFKYEDGAWLVKKTGHRVPATRELANDIFTWLTFLHAGAILAQLAADQRSQASDHRLLP